MAKVIEGISVKEDFFASTWGVKVYDYTYSNLAVDFQDLLIAITQDRAASIEQEVLPLQKIIARRNDLLERYGAVLQQLTELQAKYTGEKQSGETVQINAVIKPPLFSTPHEFFEIMSEIGYDCENASAPYDLSLTKAQVEGAVARCKNQIDEMNNESQRDMTRLQSLVDRRDESFSVATQVMTNVSDTRSAVIKNF